jgi:hypothetical protein
LVGATSALAQTDDFSSGDGAWTRYSPLTPFGGGATYSFPVGGGYEISTPASPSPGSLGPNRAGSFRSDFTYSTFSVATDVSSWNPADDQAIGVLGRLSNVGLGQTDGYLFAFFPKEGDIAINRIDNEGVTVLGGALSAIDPTKQYRLVFTGNGGTLTGSIYDLSNPGSPLATTTVTDSKYTSGFSGLFVAGTIPSGVASPTDATFARYSATVPEPSTYAMFGLGAAVFGLGFFKRQRSA